MPGMIYHYFNGTILHLSPAIIKGILENADKTSSGINSHYFIISFVGKRMNYQAEDEDIESKYKKIFDEYGTNNYELVYAKTNLVIKTIKILKDNNLIFFHNNIDPLRIQISIYLILLIFHLTKAMNKISVVCWGESDFHYLFGSKYGKVVNFIYRKAFPKLRGLITLSLGDEIFARELYPTAKVMLIPYIPQYVSSTVLSKRDVRNEALRIMVSHSGWPHNNHEYSFHLLSKYKNENIEIICPLCYGDTKYIEHIIEKGQEIFGNKFHYFKNLLPAKEYLKLLQGIDIYITATRIQTGLYALTQTLLSGSSVYLTGNLLLSMRHYGFSVKDLSALENMCFNDFSKRLSDSEIDKNVCTFWTTYNNIESLQRSWKNVFNY